MLEVQNISKKLGAVHAVDDVSLQIGEGERVAVRGDNGAGKSTLLRLIAGVLEPDRGSVLWQGEPLRGRSRRAVGYVPEAADAPPHLTVSELLHLIASTKGCDPCSRELVETLGLPDLLGARIGELSLGQRRRACLAAALVGDPGLLILDEPTNGLDPTAITDLETLLLAGESRATLFVTHDQTFASAVATRTLGMQAGKLED